LISVGILRLYVYVFINLLKLVKIFLSKTIKSNLILKKFNFRKNLFFKKKSQIKLLLSKRLTIVMRKRQFYKINKIKKLNRGNFFFKHKNKTIKNFKKGYKQPETIYL